MTVIIRVMLLAVLAAVSLPAIAPAQGMSIDSLTRRVVGPEREVADLEERVAQLEALIKVEPSRGPQLPTSATWKDQANWRQLSRGMNMDQVRALLGDPTNVQAYSSHTNWEYPNFGNVAFGSNNKVQGWRESLRQAPDGGARGL